MNSDRDILIAVKTTVENLSDQLLGGDGKPGRIPKLEETQDEHAARINKAEGAAGTLRWVVAGVLTAMLGLGTVVLAHILGGK